uniref:PCI domain containing protein n=1 Tax=Babesia bovis TaxID=5865 RepID=S6BL64_BABBO|nr:PCI domain containing protein [Babesia bovis]
MTTFVPLSQDTEGAVSSAALGDWILSIIKVREPSKTNEYYSKLLNLFQEVDGEQVIKDPFQLFELLLSGHDLVFAFLQDAKDNGESSLMSIDSVTRAEVEVPVKYGDAVKQVKEYFTVLMYMLQLRFTSNAQIDKAGTLLLKAISGGDTFVELRLKLMQMLYNSVDVTLPLRVVVYVEILEFASRHDLFHTLLPVIQKLDEWMKDWVIDKKTRINIYRIISEQLDKMGNSELSFHYWAKCIECCDQDALYTSDNLKVIADFCVRSINADGVLYFDRLRHKPAIDHLSKTEFALVVDILDLLIQGSEDDFDVFLSKHGDSALAAIGISPETVRAKLKLLTIASICQNEPEVPIARIQECLKLSKDESEELVVTAITKGVLDGLIDQRSEKVIIRSVMQRQFRKEQLQQLHSNLLQ